jgi:hypothetical protein
MWAVAIIWLAACGAGHSSQPRIDKGRSGAVSKWSEVRFGQDHQASSYPKRFGGNSPSILSDTFVGGWAKARIDATGSIGAPIHFTGH